MSSVALVLLPKMLLFSAVGVRILSWINGNYWKSLYSLPLLLFSDEQIQV